MSLTKVTYSMLAGAPLNIVDYGADPTGVFDSAPAIQLAINDAAAKKNSVRIPTGVYKCNTKITVTNSYLSIKGDGANTVIWGNHSGIAFEVGNIISGAETVGVSIEGIYFWAPSGTGINIQNTNKSNFRSIWAWASDVGFKTQELSIINTFENITVSSNLYASIRLLYPVLPTIVSANAGIFINNVTQPCNSLTFINPVVEGVGSDGILINGYHVAITLINPVSEGNAGYGYNFNGSSSSASGITVINGYSEANTRGAIFAFSQYNLMLVGGQYGQITGDNIIFNNVYVSTVTDITCFNFTENAVSAGNVYTNIANSGTFSRSGFLATLTPISPTPSVHNPDVIGSEGWKTANYSGTVYTNFLGGYAGLYIKVFIRDSFTTVKFTSPSLLKGNSGVDWIANSGDWMDCTYDGVNWYCAIHKS